MEGQPSAERENIYKTESFSFVEGENTANVWVQVEQFGDNDFRVNPQIDNEEVAKAIDWIGMISSGGPIKTREEAVAQADAEYAHLKEQLGNK